jgi:uncharacterized protein (DUF2147 family)
MAPSTSLPSSRSPPRGISHHHGGWWTCRALRRSNRQGSGTGYPAANASGRARRAICAAVLTVIALSLTGPLSANPTAVPEGMWLVDANSVLQIFDCNGRLCGRVAWLENAHEATRGLRHDVKNPDPTLRERLVCGLTVLWALQPAGCDSWKGGWFYNPDDGKTYRAAAELPSKDTLIARIYVGVPLLGRMETLVRMPRQSSDSQC